MLIVNNEQLSNNPEKNVFNPTNEVKIETLIFEIPTEKK